MLIIVAFVLLLLLPSPWNLLAFGVAGLLGVVELLFWNRTVRNRRKQVGAGTLLGRTATVVFAVSSRGAGPARRRDLGCTQHGGNRRVRTRSESSGVIV